MKSIILKDFGSVDNLTITDLPIPSLQEGEVLIRTKAISINPIDLKTRAGRGASAAFKDTDPIILGWDVSGIVETSKSDLFKTGDAVFGMVNFPGQGKAYAEYVAAPASHLALKPDNISHEAAAASSLAALTVWQILKSYAKIKKGDRVLIHAAAGGVGHYAVQMAKYLGAHVIGTSSAAKKDFVLSLGADEHIDYQKQPLEEATKDIDFVLDSLGGESIDHSLNVMKKGGTIVSIPSGLNEQVGEKAAAKGMHGFATKAYSSGTDMQEIAELLKNGQVKSHISQTFKLEQMREAHLSLETGKTQGKIVLTF
ncbi:NADP-dependent oxidoreductase [Pedobacter sp. MC2016-24]|uniref:NADP-dependent oxidoreductase n=1 Tax=Pedobacter sp. MC2016-24 TaxID=2780090 RepID=UPI001882ADB7|nr:NADP-dependent oxidoreductase [Pedobacter sp. MC2016-24]MBE9599340.1 NADP-dependent oxidoreductase [Pedobacter sp. MC2016-24]